VGIDDDNRRAVVFDSKIRAERLRFSGAICSLSLTNCSDLPIWDADKRGRTQMFGFMSAFIRDHPRPSTPTVSTYESEA